MGLPDGLVGSTMPLILSFSVNLLPQSERLQDRAIFFDSFSTSDFFSGPGSSAEDNGADLGCGYHNLIAEGSKLKTTEPDPNIGNPISVSKVSQYTDGYWDMGAFNSSPKAVNNNFPLCPPGNIQILTTSN